MASQSVQGPQVLETNVWFTSVNMINDASMLFRPGLNVELYMC